MNEVAAVIGKAIATSRICDTCSSPTSRWNRCWCKWERRRRQRRYFIEMFQGINNGIVVATGAAIGGKYDADIDRDICERSVCAGVSREGRRR